MKTGRGVMAFMTWPWAAALATALVAAFVCTQLGMWQWHRREARVARNAVIVENYDAPAKPLDDALSWFASGDDREWTHATLTGRYVPDKRILVRSRPLAGGPTMFILEPFEDAASGKTLVVNRGYVPEPEDGTLPDIPARTGEQTITVNLRPPEPEDDRGRIAPAGQAFRVIPDKIFPSLDVVNTAYGVLHNGVDEGAGSPEPLPYPETDEGPHLSYTFQWFVFALGCLVGFGLVVRRSDTWQIAGGAAVPEKKAKKPTAEDIEDALVDASLSGER